MERKEISICEWKNRLASLASAAVAWIRLKTGNYSHIRFNGWDYMKI